MEGQVGVGAIELNSAVLTWLGGDAAQPCSKHQLLLNIVGIGRSNFWQIFKCT